MPKNNTVTESEAKKIIEFLKSNCIQYAVKKFKFSRFTIINIIENKHPLVKDVKKFERPPTKYSNRDFSVYA
jgi:hypothetical protein